MKSAWLAKEEQTKLCLVKEAEEDGGADDDDDDDDDRIRGDRKRLATAFLYASSTSLVKKPLVSVYAFDDQVQDDMPSSCLGDIV